MRGKWIERPDYSEVVAWMPSSLVRGKWIERPDAVTRKEKYYVFPREREVD